MPVDISYLQPMFNTLAQGVQVAQQVKQAAMQQQENDRQNELAQSRQALAEREFNANQQASLADMLKNGAQPVDGSGNISTPNPSITSAPVPMTADKNMQFNSPFMTSTINPTGGGTAQVPADPSQTVTVGGRQVQMPSWSDQLQRAGQFKEAQADATRVPITREGSDMIGGMFPAGTLVDPAHMPGLAAIARAKAAADAGQGGSGKTIVDKKLSADDKGNETWKVLYDDGTIAEIPTKAKGKSDKFDPANAAANATAGQTKALTDTARQTAMERAQRDYQDATKEEGELHAWRMSAGVALRSGQHTIDKNGALKRFSADATDEEKKAEQEGLKALFEAKTNRLQQVITQKNDAMQRLAQLSNNPNANPTVSTDQAVSKVQGGKPAAPAPAPAQPKPAAAEPAGKQPAKALKPLTDKAEALEYLKKAGGNKDKARELARADGRSF